MFLHTPAAVLLFSFPWSFLLVTGLGLHNMVKNVYLNIYAKYLNTDTIWQVLFDILTLETLKIALFWKKKHNKKWSWEKCTFSDFLDQ